MLYREKVLFSIENRLTFRKMYAYLKVRYFTFMAAISTDHTALELDALTLELSDQDVLRITDEYIAIGKNTKNDMDEQYEKNKKYYRNKQFDDQCITDNRIFISVETIVPIATSNTPKPNVNPAQDTPESFDLARNWEKLLMDTYKKQNIQKMMERCSRHLIIGKFAVVKYLYDEENEKLKTRVIHPLKCFFDNNCDIDDGLGWFGERLVVPASTLVKMFPKKKKEIKAKVKNKMGTRIEYLEIWTDEMLITRYDDIVLQKIKNPNFDYNNEKNNFFPFPKIPYIITNLFDLGGEIGSSTCLLDQVIPLQDGLNKRKQQIDRNADLMNGKAVGLGGEGVTEKEFTDIDWADPTEGVFLSNGTRDAVQRVTGSPLPQFIENDMVDSRNEIDNVMGTHSTTRGEREGRETATGRQLLRDSDRGRIDLIGRRLEELLTELFKGWTQIVKVFYKTPQLTVVLNEDKTKEFLEIDRNSIEDGMEIEIIPGTMIPQDKASKQQRALTLANAQMIDPESLYKDFGYQNPKEMAKRLYLWQNNPEALFNDLEPTGDQAEGQKEQQIMKAEDENNRMAQGQTQPPYEQADAQHLNVHQIFMGQPQFQELTPEIQQLFIDHVRGETEIVQESIKQ